MSDLYVLVGTVVNAWVIVAWFACAAFCGHLAEEKRHCWPCWLILGLLFGPLALIAAAGLPDKHVSRVVAVAEPDAGTAQHKALGFRQKKSHYELILLTIVIVGAIAAFYILR